MEGRITVAKATARSVGKATENNITVGRATDFKANRRKNDSRGTVA